MLNVRGDWDQLEVVGDQYMKRKIEVVLSVINSTTIKNSFYKN